MNNKTARQNMRKVLLITVAFIGAIISQAQGMIIETPDLSKLEAELQKVDKNSLVMFDVDDTLIYPTDLIQRAKHWEYRDKITQQTLKNPAIVPEGKYEKDYLHSTILNSSEFVLVDPKIVSIIKELQERHIPTIAFTKMGSWSLGVIPSLTEFRYKQLKAHEIDFSGAFADPKYPKNCITVKDGKSYCFRKGILFSNEYDKGPILQLFLKTMNLKPNKIVFLDDRYDYLETVEAAMKDSGIEFIGLHYTAADKNPSQLDEEVARFQYHYVAQHGVWINEEKARQLMQEAAEQEPSEKEEEEACVK